MLISPGIRLFLLSIVLFAGPSQRPERVRSVEEGAPVVDLSRTPLAGALTLNPRQSRVELEGGRILVIDRSQETVQVFDDRGLPLALLGEGAGRGDWSDISRHVRRKA